MSIATAASLMLAIASAPMTTASAGPETMTFRITGRVPTLCRIHLSSAFSAPDASGVADLGTAEEFCNAPNGYRVIVNHQSGLQGAAIIRRGVRIPLSPTGQTVIVDAMHPALERLSMALDVGDQPERMSAISIRIEAKG